VSENSIESFRMCMGSDSPNPIHDNTHASIICKKEKVMRSSRFYQNCIQVIGSVSEVILFLGGFFLGKEMFITAFIFLLLRMSHKIVISELMYRRSKLVVREEVNPEDS